LTARGAGATNLRPIASRTKPRFAPAGWVAVAALAGLALVAAVVTDLRRAVAAQTERARLLAARDAQRGAVDLRTWLGDPAGCGRAVPADRSFTFDGATLRSEPPVRAEPEPGFDPERELDVLAAERIRRAGRSADPGAALAELEVLRSDPALQPRARAWVRARMAWIAQRAGRTAERDALLAEGLDDPALLLLAATAGSPDAEALGEAFDALAARAEPARLRLCCDQLDGLGLPTAGFRATIAAVEGRRALLAAAAGFVAEFASAREPLLRPVDGRVLLFWPAAGRGAVVEPELLAALGTDAIEARPVLVTAPFGADAVPVVEGLLAVRPAALEEPGLLAGATGTALLVAALALLCGGGSFLAYRALRREAEALRLRGEFLTTVTHELKTPLAGVRLVAELLVDDHVTEADERRAWLLRLDGEAARLGVLIENVLDLGRLDRGERGHAPEPTDVGALVADVLAWFAPLAARDGTALQSRLPDAPIGAAVDRGALRQALVNVLDNARRYGRPPLEVEVRRDGDAVEIAVRDHGAGVPAAERAAIFERFRRGSAQAHGGTPGVGIGLHLARAIAERHGGTLRCVDPPDGPGVRFVFRLPATEVG
jgi:signal transduction histidine kinase